MAANLRRYISDELQTAIENPVAANFASLTVLDDGPQKPISIHQSVGQRPILAAGNTDGDLPMLQWTAASSHRTLQLAVHHTDADREYAYHQSACCGWPPGYKQWVYDSGVVVDCACGLAADLRLLGLPVEWAGDPPA